MSRTSHDLTTHLVRWTEPKPTLDHKTFFNAEHRGVVLSQIFNDGRFICLVVDAQGRLYTKPVSELTMIYPPISAPRNGHNTEPTQNIKQNTQ